jgi:hypothetical protein
MTFIAGGGISKGPTITVKRKPHKHDRDNRKSGTAPPFCRTLIKRTDAKRMHSATFSIFHNNRS